MLTEEELDALYSDSESHRVERKPSEKQGESIRKAICAFANDLPNYHKSGVVFVGVNDDGTCAGYDIGDEVLRTLADMRSDGNILPLPRMSVEKKRISGCDIAVVIVEPSDSPPVRYKGRVYVRVGPSNRHATDEEERTLCEKRRARDLPFDLHPMSSASIGDLDLRLFQEEYLVKAVAPEVLDANRRTIEQQLCSLRLLSPDEPYFPTVLGLLVIGNDAREFVPGAYVQLVRFDGTELTDPIKDQTEIGGPVGQLLLQLDEKFKAHISVASNIADQSIELRRPNYPIVALQQLARNAVLHRSYEVTNAPTRINWFNDRIEIQNPGGPYGQVTRENFGQPGISDYRNPHLAEALKTLGFVQRFGIGIPLARRELEKNGNPPPKFHVEQSHVLVTIRVRP